jgi:hypothetical protein
MPISWQDDAKTVLYFNPQGEWTWEEFFDAAGQVNGYIAGVSHPVFVITNLNDSILPPGNAIPHFRNDILQKPENTAALIFLINDGFKRTMISVLREMIHGKHGEMLFSANSLDEAYDIIDGLKNS